MILVVGDVIDDFLVRPEGPLRHATDTRASIARTPGGSGANIACWLGHAGAAVGFVGRVGRDDVARHEALLQAHGVTPHLQVDETLPTGTIIALISPDGERSFLTDRGANLHLAPLDGSLLRGVRHLHVSGHTLLADGPRAAVLPLIAAARQGGVPFSVDAGSAAWLAESGAARFCADVSGASLCVANHEEAALLGDVGVPLLFTHAEGASLNTGGTLTVLKVRSVRPVDTTGAGDAFAAGFLAARLRGDDDEKCLRAGCELAQQSLRRAGGRP